MKIKIYLRITFDPFLQLVSFYILFPENIERDQWYKMG